MTPRISCPLCCLNTLLPMHLLPSAAPSRGRKSKISNDGDVVSACQPTEDMLCRLASLSRVSLPRGWPIATPSGWACPYLLRPSLGRLRCGKAQAVNPSVPRFFQADLTGHLQLQPCPWEAPGEVTPEVSFFLSSKIPTWVLFHNWTQVFQGEDCRMNWSLLICCIR